MVVAGGFKPAIRPALEILQEGDEPVMVGRRLANLKDGDAAGTVLNESDVPIFSDIDCNEIRAAVE